MAAIRACPKTTIAAFCAALLPLATAPAWAGPTFDCPGVRYIGNTSVTVVDPYNTGTNCTTSSDGAMVAADGALNVVTGFFLSGWSLITSAVGQLLRVSNDTGITWNLGPMPGHLTTVGSSPGQTTQYQYDSLGRIESTTAPGSVVTQYTYDALSNRVQTVDRSGNTTTYTYDPVFRPATVSETASPNRVTYTYDSGSTRPATSTESVGPPTTVPPDRRITYTYDAGNGDRLQTRVETPSGTTTQYTYDNGTGRLSQITETPPAPPSRTTQYTYDNGTGNLTQVEVDTNPPPPAPVITRYHYDTGTNLLTEVERDGVITTRYEYDAGGHLTDSIDDPNGANRQTRFTYDALGMLSSITDPSGRSIGSFAYVAEPGSLLLLGLGLGALALRRRV